jgi:hypothetical protein
MILGALLNGVDDLTALLVVIFLVLAILALVLYLFRSR